MRFRTHRTHYYLSKLVVAALLSLVGVIILTALGMISFSIAFGFGEVAGINHYFSYAIQAFLTLYVLILSNVSIYMMIGFLTKNSGISLIWTFIYTIATGFGAPIFLQNRAFQAAHLLVFVILLVLFRFRQIGGYRQVP